MRVEPRTSACRWACRALAVDAGRCRACGPPEHRRRHSQARGARLGRVGHGPGPLRGRHARHRQRHRLRQGPAADPALGADALPRARPPDADASRDPAATTTSTSAPGRELLHRLRPDRIGRGARVPTADGTGAVRQPGQRRQHAHVRADLERRLPGVAPAARRSSGRSSSRRLRSAPTSSARRRRTTTSSSPSNTTEAINLVAESVSRDAGPGIEPVVVNTLLEHNSNELPWRRLPGVVAGPAADGRRGLRGLGRAGGAPAARTTSDGEHGSEANRARGRERRVERARRVQRPGRDRPDRAPLRRTPAGGRGAAGRPPRGRRWRGCGIDYLAFSAHKAYAPFGTGVLVARKGLLALQHRRDGADPRRRARRTSGASPRSARRSCCCSGSAWT